MACEVKVILFSLFWFNYLLYEAKSLVENVTIERYKKTLVW